MQKIWKISGTILYVWMKVIFNANCSNFGQIGLQNGQKLVHLISRISRNFSREMGHIFSHLARNPKREKCAGLNLSDRKIPKFPHCAYLCSTSILTSSSIYRMVNPLLTTTWGQPCPEQCWGQSKVPNRLSQPLTFNVASLKDGPLELLMYLTTTNDPIAC